jgi:hypothetical protein
MREREEEYCSEKCSYYSREVAALLTGNDTALKDFFTY